jgi:hypothetical protein
VHQKHDFTKEEYSRARELILDAMAADITAKLQVPEEHPSEYAMSEGSWPALSTSLFAADHLSAPAIHCAPPLEEYVAADAAALRMSAPSRRRVGTFSLRGLPISNWMAASITAGVALILVVVVPVFWFATDQNSTESWVAVQPSPHESFDIRAEIAGPKQVETTAAPLGDKDELLRSVVPTDWTNPAEMADLLKSGGAFRARDIPFLARDIPTARLALKLAAEAGNASAALELGRTYDPVILERLKAQRQPITAQAFGPNRVGDPNLEVAPDIAMARAWYQRAKELGSAEASKRLEMLQGVDH